MSSVMPQLPKSLLVDLDDTILAYGAVSGSVWLDICEQYTGRLPGWTAERLSEGINSYRQWFWSDPDRHRRGRLNLVDVRHEIVLGAFRQMGIDAQDVARSLGEDYARERDARVRPFSGAIEALASLQNTGVRMALITNGNSKSQRGKIERFDLERFFDCVLIEGEFGIGKPDERVYLEALRQLGSAPEDAWIIGDNLEWEVRAPQRLGIYAIWNDYANTGLPVGSDARPDRIVTAFSELLDTDSS